MWEKLFSSERLGSIHHLVPGQESVTQNRTSFQRDYDRLIFSSPFRRLQNKTQVFPLPGSVFVHNRLTHSLEVASVGRSLGNMVGNVLSELPENREMSAEGKDFYLNQLGIVIASACLAHDIGNPPFGHSGESAISQFFIKHPELSNNLSTGEWADLTNFEGNANALRVMAHRFNGRREGGYCLTWSTLISIIKYPCASTATDKSKLSRKKYGFFQSEQEIFRMLAQQFGLKMQQETPIAYSRHPFVFLVEAADDICYRIIDLEDAHRLGIISYEIAIEIFMALNIALKGVQNTDKIQKGMHQVAEYDKNERLAYLRAVTINNLVSAVAEVFLSNRQSILSGNFETSLLDGLTSEARSVLERLEKLSFEKIYNHPSSVEVEISGYKVLGGLLQEFVPAMMQPDSGYSKKLIKLIPVQYHYNGANPYQQIQTAVDFVAGMTDLYAVELYRKLAGVGI
jgi:dGTPase